MDSVIHIVGRLLKAFGVEKVTPHPSLRFHKKRGKNICMEQKNALASRVCDYKYGMVFSQRPVDLNEAICVQILKKNSKWQGNLRVGFSHINPNHFNSEELEGSKVLETIWGPCCWFFSIYETDYTFVTFRMKADGNITIKVDDNEERIVGPSLHHLSPTDPLWAAIDVYGSVNAVQFVYHPVFMKSISPSPSPDENRNEMSSTFPAFNSQNNRPNVFTFDFQSTMLQQAYSGAASVRSPLLSPSDFTTPDLNSRRAPCVICMENEADSAFVDCGHLCCCYDCANKHWAWSLQEDNECKCPVCRQKARSFLRIY